MLVFFLYLFIILCVQNYHFHTHKKKKFNILLQHFTKIKTEYIW